MANGPVPFFGSCRYYGGVCSESPFSFLFIFSLPPFLFPAFLLLTDQRHASSVKTATPDRVWAFTLVPSSPSLFLLGCTTLTDLVDSGLLHWWSRKLVDSLYVPNAACLRVNSAGMSCPVLISNPLVMSNRPSQHLIAYRNDSCSTNVGCSQAPCRLLPSDACPLPCTWIWTTDFSVFDQQKNEAVFALLLIR